MLIWNIEELTKAFTSIFTTTRYLNRNIYFYRYKVRKNKDDSYSNLYDYFLHFKFAGRNIKIKQEPC